MKKALRIFIALVVLAALGFGVLAMMSNPQYRELILHPDRNLAWFLGRYGGWAYAILFVVVFCETGLVVTPFLPGDSLLFATGLMASTGKMNPMLICVTLVCAALLGDNVNYFLGCKFGLEINGVRL